MSFLRNYILDEEFQIQYLRGKINIKNYIKINYMENERVSLSYSKGTVIVYGTNLRIKKLLDSEILIDGKIDSIELRRGNNA